jgi:hypothetical protein
MPKAAAKAAAASAAAGKRIGPGSSAKEAEANRLHGALVSSSTDKILTKQLAKRLAAGVQHELTLGGAEAAGDGMQKCRAQLSKLQDCEQMFRQLVSKAQQKEVPTYLTCSASGRYVRINYPGNSISVTVVGKQQHDGVPLDHDACLWLLALLSEHRMQVSGIIKADKRAAPAWVDLKKALGKAAAS